MLFNDSDTALRTSAFLQTGGTLQVIAETQDNFGKVNDVRWQPSGARQIAKGNPQGERGGVHQFGVPPKPAQRDSANLLPEGKPQVVSEAKDNMVALPSQLFYSTPIKVCLWFLAKNKSARKVKRGDGEIPECIRNRKVQTLFIDARKMGTLIVRVHRELTDADLEKIVSTYHEWRFDQGVWRSEAEKLGAFIPPADQGYQNIPGFSKFATTAEIAAHGHVLTPGRYVGAEEVEDDGEPFEEKMPCLVAELAGQFMEPANLEAAIRANLKGHGYAF